jgi:penicillin-binding protein 1C
MRSSRSQPRPPLLWLRRWLVVAAVTAATLWVGERAISAWSPYPLDVLQRLPVSTVVQAHDGSWLRVVPTPAGERVLPLDWDEASPMLRAAVVAGEDRNFFEHSGVDVPAVLRAAAGNLTAGRVVSGASTLTMQVVRMVEPRPRTLWSKVVEAFRARQLERLLSKDEIASVWLTHVPMGGTLRGMEAASRYWFGVSARELGAGEAAALVAMVPAPSARAPHRHPERLRYWRLEVLRRMVASGLLDSDEAAAVRAMPIAMERHEWPWRMQHYCDAVLARWPRRQAPCIMTTAADVELQQRLEEVVGGAWWLPGEGVAVVAVDLSAGEVVAVLGDRDPRAPLDLSTCRRSAGSTLKPFLYALAHDRGVAGSDILIDDSPLVYGQWRPANFDGGHAGRMRPADALATSNNVVAVRCLQRVSVDRFVALLQDLGLPVGDSGIHLDAALGTVAVSPRQLADAWWRFVTVPDDLVLSRSSVAFALQAMRELSPVESLGRAGALSWKSGTSSGLRDAWSVGVTDRHVVVVWVGNPDGRGDAGLTGVRTANRLLADVVAAL